MAIASRPCFAWAEGTAEVDIEAIKRSINASEAPPMINLAVDLSVAEALQTRKASTICPMPISRPWANGLFGNGKMTVNAVA